MTILNKYKHSIPDGAVYIGRGSKWGNPFTHLPNVRNTTLVKDRDEACDKHLQYLRNQVKSGEITVEDLMELYNKDLVCFCAPKRCHGENLVKAANWAFTQISNKENHEPNS